MEKPITASLLYDLVQCPQRVALDLFGDPGKRDEISPFVRMLWERGALHEREAVEGLELPFLDLSGEAQEDRQRLTLEAMQRGDPLIYGGLIAVDGLVGIPDLLRLEGRGYVPMDIKSGRGKEGDGEEGDGKPKQHYAVQLALYVDLLERLGFSAGRYGVIWDVRGDEVIYRLDETRGVRIKEALWDEYVTWRGRAQSIIDQTWTPKGALASGCKLCHWYSACSKSLRNAGDLSLIPFLGRSKRDSLEATFPTLSDLAGCDPEGLITKKGTGIPGVGPDGLRTFHARAKLLTDPDAKPYLKAEVGLPISEVEFFFDIEVDPLRDFTYLHGIVERRGGDNDSERFVSFFADEETPAAEEASFAQAFAFLTSVPEATIWYFSKYERTIYRKLAKRYPGVCSEEAIEELFNPARAVDLYFDVVLKATEWPTNDHSVKTLAKYLGFAWRDTNPSGAASIEWFDRWVRTRDPTVKARILDYNEDDCRATRVLLDGIREMASA